ncbi:MAG: hypothetical protein WAP03_13170 [Methylorubrum rhodinum]|uniref:hypothetical protein n=1 Tax=Methylorubrum rhodinum TaxID=29428 RepID=UPI003BB05566
MDAVTPRQLTLDELSRDELLEFARRVAPFHRQRDLWWAVWNAAASKADAAGKAALAANQRSADAAAVWAAAKTARSLDQGRKAYFLARDEHAKLDRASRRADAAERRAFAALSACIG